MTNDQSISLRDVAFIALVVFVIPIVIGVLFALAIVHG